MLILGFLLLSSAWAQFDPTCKDKLDTCDQFPESSCKAPYEEWAKANCNNTCKICNGAPKAAPPCMDTINNCDAYDKPTCDDPLYKQWAESKCRYYCRKCTASQLLLVDSRTTTIPPSVCKDKLDCRTYGADSCKGNFEHWAKENCMQFCGFCKGVPTPPHACVDKIPNCSSYDKDTCTSKDYAIWAQDHCAKYCGICGGGSVHVNTPPPIHPVTSGPGPVTPPGPHIFLTPPVPGRK